MIAGISKVLVANRGEIAIRAFRAAYELDVATVAIYPYEDRNSLHRLKADESYQIGERGHPVRAYLNVDEIVATARACGADAIYPGYGFLSENPDLAAACAAAGITFVGPSAEVLELTGNKARAIAAARAAGLPVLASSAPSSSVDELVAAAGAMTFPLVRQGRGRRRRPWHAPGERPGRIAGGDRSGQSRSGVGVRGCDGVPRAGGDQPPPHRGADPGRHAGQRDPSVRARLQRAAPPPEGHRVGAGAEPRSGAARADLRRRGGVRPPDRLQLRGHGGVPARRAWSARVHRDEPAHPGRAHGHRGDHRRRPGVVAAAHRERGNPGITLG